MDNIDDAIESESSSDSFDGDINCVINKYHIKYTNILKKLQKIEQMISNDYIVSFLRKDIYKIIIEFMNLCNEFDYVIKKLSKKYDDITITSQLQPINVIIHKFIRQLEYPTVDQVTISFTLNIIDLYHDIFVLDNVIFNTTNTAYPKTMYNDIGTRFKKLGDSIQNKQNLQNNPVVAILMNDVECLLYAVYSINNNNIETFQFFCPL